MSSHKEIDRDLGKLDPIFRERVEELLRRMQGAGHDPIVWEGMRTFERAEELQRKGSGVARSMHCYGLAVDIISARNMWSAPPAFWRALRDMAENLGLTSGARFKRVDSPHVQALPARDDAWVRNATAAQIAERVALELDASDPANRTTVRDVK